MVRGEVAGATPAGKDGSVWPIYAKADSTKDLLKMVCFLRAFCKSKFSPGPICGGLDKMKTLPSIYLSCVSHVSPVGFKASQFHGHMFIFLGDSIDQMGTHAFSQDNSPPISF